MYKLGDIVKIRKEWLNTPSERNNRYIVTNVNTVTKRCYIKCVTSNLPLVPEELVGFNMIEKITIERVAEKFNYSKSYITRVCKKELGMSFAEFVRQKKIYKACNDLERTDYKVCDIAKMAGFNDIPHFTECFKKYTGMSPGEYRKSRRKTHKWYVGMEDLKYQREIKSKIEK